MNDLNDHKIIVAAECNAVLARDMARTLDSAAEQITRAANPYDVTTMTDLLHQASRIQRVIQQAHADLAPERITRFIAELTE